MDQPWQMVRQRFQRIAPWLFSLGLVIFVQLWVLAPMVNRFFSVEVEAIGGLEREWQGEVLVLPQEELVLASAPGRVTFLVQHGQWVAPGSILAEIIGSEGSSEVVYCPCGGLVSLQPDEGQKMVVKSGGNRSGGYIDGDEVETGGQLARILRPGKICLRIHNLPFRLPTDSKVAISAGETADGFQGSGKGQLYAAELKSVEDSILNLQVSNFPVEWLDKDSMVVVLRVRGPAGQRIPVTAITVDQAQQGVFVVTDSGYRFRRVEVLDRWGRDAVVNGLGPGERVVSRPWLAMVSGFRL